MAYKALYRTYRPQTFEEVAGQKHIVRTLKNALEKGKIAHAYLFCGPRGTGKTTMAKLLAKALDEAKANVAPADFVPGVIGEDVPAEPAQAETADETPTEKIVKQSTATTVSQTVVETSAHVVEEHSIVVTTQTEEK